MMQFIKNRLKKHFYILKVRERLSPQVGIQQRLLFHQYQDLRAQGRLPGLSNTGFRVFSQFEEDGKLLYIFSLIGMPYKTFLDIGSDDGVNSNCANLYFHFGWNGVFIDGNAAAIKRGQRFYAKYPHPYYPSPTFVPGIVMRENVNQLVQQGGLSGTIDLLSIDIDGNDYWIWDALEVVSPRVVMIETHVEFGLQNVVVPYDPNYVYPGKHPDYHGASPVAMVKLAERKGYRLVGANDLGFNFIFVKNGVGEKELPAVPVESVLQHPRTIASFARFEAIKDWDYLEG